MIAYPLLYDPATEVIVGQDVYMGESFDNIDNEDDNGEEDIVDIL